MHVSAELSRKLYIKTSLLCFLKGSNHFPGRNRGQSVAERHFLGVYFVVNLLLCILLFMCYRIWCVVIFTENKLHSIKDN